MGLEKINIWKKELGITNDELANRSGIPKSTIDKITSGLTFDPKLETVRAITKALNKTINDLDDTPDVTSDKSILEQVQEHIKKYRDLDDHGRSTVDFIVNSEHERMKQLSKLHVAASNEEFSPEITPVYKQMKVFNEAAAAGLGNYLSGDDQNYEIISFLESEIPYHTDFGIRISGDSMTPTIEDGSIVWVEATPAVDTDDIGIFILNGESYCKELQIKYVKNKKTVSLVSHNKKFNTIIIKESDELRTVGRVLFL